MSEKQQSQEQKKNNEIDLIDVILKIWNGRKIIIKSILVFFVIGVFIVILSPKEYKSDITLVVETSNSSNNLSGMLQQFGGLTGININKAEKEAITPELYPEVIKSTPFLLEIMKQNVVESKYDSTLTVEQYLDRYYHSSISNVIMKYTIGLPGKIVEWIKGNKESKVYNKFPILSSDSALSLPIEPINITKKQSEIIETLSDCISTEQDFKNSNKFVISVEMQDPLVVAQVTSSVVKNLTKYIIEYRTKKSKTDLKFVEERTTEAETKYLEAQQALAIYKDRNKNVILSSVQTKEDQLQSEYDLAFSVYSALAKQLEQAKIKVQEETPVFNVMNPAQVPLKKSKPQFNVVIGMMCFLGLFTGLVIVLSQGFFSKYKKI